MTNLLSPTRQIILLSDRQGLSSRLKDQFSNCRVSTASNLDELLQSCQAEFACFSVVDFKKLGNLPDALVRIHDFLMRGNEACLIMLIEGDEGIPAQRLLQTGIHAIIGPDPTRIAMLAGRYWKTVKWPPQKVTQTIISNLPWSPIE